jgi:REP element-mobilizing transposase RayT
MLLVPDKACWQIFLYCLALAAERHGIRIHAVVMMGNHYHIVLTDMEGQLPLFMQWFNRQLARCIQRHRGWEHEVWEPNRKYNAVELMSEEAMWEAVLYVLTNPIKAGLVSSLSQWKRGLIGPAQLARGTIKVSRPTVLFNDTAPESATLRLSAPEALGASTSAFAEALEELLPDAIGNAREKVSTVIGWKRVVKTPFKSRPQSQRARVSMSPALKAVGALALREAIQGLRAFRNAYREAYEAFRDGAYGMLFPEGTWWMVRFGGAACSS